MVFAQLPRHLRWIAVFMWLATLFNVVIALAGDGVSKAQLVMIASLAFSSGMFAAWASKPPIVRS